MSKELLSAEEAESQLKKIWATDEFKFVARYQKNEDRKGGFLTDLKANDREIIYPRRSNEQHKYSRKVNVSVPPSLKLEHDKHYNIEVALEEHENRLTNPYKLKLIDFYELAHYKTPKEFITERFFEKGNSPSDAATIASQLSLNELELYTHTKRFIFELIQNADDMPREDKSVNIEIYLTKNFLLFLHDGKFFDRGDVEAICDAARSNKKQNTIQTGYKGIGFKSVFTDSSKVYIKSGSYSFKFDKDAEVYKDFWKLYSGRVSELNQEARDAFKVKYSRKESEYLKMENIPWQIKPIWTERDEYPLELTNSPFIDPKYQVAIALEVGEAKINDKEKDYHRMITELINEPRFLLFLRNATGLNYQRLNEENSIETNINIKKRPSSIEVENNGQLLAKYLKRDFEVILSNEDFQKAGLNFSKIEKGKKIVFIDSEGIPLKDIPEKLVNLKKTTLSFAAKIDSNKIQSLTFDNSILFNYLPTSDNRFGFHFLVNADFVSKTDREFIQIENKWNHYLFFKIGFNLINWLAKILKENESKTNEKNKINLKFVNSYLSLLPKKLLDEENQERGPINKAFNNGLKEGLREIEFILTSDGSIKKVSDIIIDTTGIVGALKGRGIGFLKFAIKTTKEFNNFRIDENQLKADYLEIEKFGRDELVNALLEKDNKELFRNTIKNLDEEDYKSFLSWLDLFLNVADTVNKIGEDLPFIKINNQVFSIKECHENTLVIIKTKRIEDLESILIKIQFKLSEFYLDEYDQLLGIVKRQDSYITNDLKLYKVISSSPKLDKLTSVEKNQLLDFLIELDQVGPDKVYSEIRLFQSKKGKFLFPLSHLISSDDKTIPIWFDSVVILDREKVSLSVKHQKILNNRELVLKNILCKPELFRIVSLAVIEKDDFDKFYEFLEDLFAKRQADEKDDFSAIPWIYSQKQEKFLLSSEIYCPDSFYKTSNIFFYYDLKDKIEKATDLNLPMFCSHKIISLFNIGCITSSIQKHITKEVDFDLPTLKTFLKWLEVNNEDGFLRKYNFINEGGVYKLKFNDVLPYYYTQNPELVFYIENNKLLQEYNLLPHELFSKNSEEIGLLCGEKLAFSLIENGANQLGFSKFIPNYNNDKVSEKYLEKIQRVDISSGKIYDKNSEEHNYFKLIENLEAKKEDKADLFLNEIRVKIFLDSTLLSDKAVSEDVYFPGNDQNKGYNISISLSQILPQYKDSSFSLNSTVESFPGVKSNLIRRIFKVSSRNVNGIFKELTELKLSYFNSFQTYFLIRYKNHFQYPNVLKSTPSFSFLTNLEDKNLYYQEAINFLDLNFDDGFTDSLVFDVLGINISNFIFDAEFSVSSEKLPDWILKWCNCDQLKIKYLNLCGLNHEASPVVVLRSGLIRNNPDLIGKGRENLQNPLLLKNTLEWLVEKQDSQSIALKKEYLSPLYIKLKREAIPISQIPIPIIKVIGVDNYHLKGSIEKTKVHLFNSTWGNYSNDIFIVLSKKGISVIDDTIGKEYLAELVPQNIRLFDGIDFESLKSNSVSLAIEWYVKWPKKSQFPIYVYPGKKIPNLISYSNFFQIRSESGLVCKNGNDVYVVKAKENSLLDELEELLVPSVLSELHEEKRKFDKAQKEKESKISYSEEEEEALMRIFGDNAPRGFRKDLNLASLIKGLSYLHFNGYDVSHAELNLVDSHKFSQLFPVYKNGVPFTVKCRSAKSGLLYLRASSWKELENPNTYLFVWTGSNITDSKLCKSREEVIEDLNADYQVIRLESKPSVSNLDNFLNGNLNPENIWLIIRTKFKEEYKGIFEDIRKKSKTDHLDNLSPGNEDED
jgi:hypothetical protein